MSLDCTVSAILALGPSEIEPSNVPPPVTVSVGVAPIGSGSDDTPEQVIGAADQALYRAKHEGRNQVRVVDPDSWTTTGSQYAA